MKQQELLTESRCYHLAWAVRDGNATPEEARSVLEFFCRQVSDGRGVSPWLLGHFGDCFQMVLTGERTTDAALGLRRGKPGRRSNLERNPNRVYAIVGALLEHRLNGCSYEIAVNRVSNELHVGPSQIGEMWGTHKGDALIMCRMARDRDQIAWTAEELGVLEGIYPEDQWVIRSGKLTELTGVTQ